MSDAPGGYPTSMPGSTDPLTGAAPFVPETSNLRRLRAAVHDCRGCDLYLPAIQAVFGAGRRHSALMLVGEQPGDVEDREGEPFVGPAGRLLDRALAQAGIDRADAYLTNAVKHFRFKATDSGKRRLHQTPRAGEVTACRPWLVAELRAVAPLVLVALGATAAQSLLGNGFRVTEQRGQRLPWPPPAGPFAGDPTPVQTIVATVHPSAVLRARPGERREALTRFVSDLRVAANAVTAATTRDGASHR